MAAAECVDPCTSSSSAFAVESLVLNYKMMKPLDKALRCSICFDYYKNCMMTKCSHNYCSVCIRRYMTYKSQCPTCFQDASEPELRNNRLIDEILRLYMKLRGLHGEEDTHPLKTPELPLRTIYVKESSDSFQSTSKLHSPSSKSSDPSARRIKIEIPDDTETRQDNLHVNIKIEPDFDEDNSAKAKKKAEVAINTSNLDTDSCEIENPRFDKRKLTDILDLSSEDEDNVVHKKRLTASPPVVLLQESEENVHESTSTPFPTCNLVVAQNEPTPFQKQILGQIEELKMIVSNFTKTMKTMPSDGSTASTLSSSSSNFENLPIDSVEQLNDWENHLNSSENFSNCVKYLGRFVSHDASSSIRRILSKLLTDNLAKNFNWKGRPPKKAFRNLKSVNLILYAVKENPLLKNILRKKVEDVIKDWLKHATFRLSYKNTGKKN